MAKQLGQVRLLITGDEDGATVARFEYVVTHSDDASLTKYAALDVDTPVFSVGDVNEFFDGYVDTIKSNEGIA